MLLSFAKAQRIYGWRDHTTRQKAAGTVGDVQILLKEPSEGSTLPDMDQGHLPKTHDIWVRTQRVLYTDPR